MKKVYFLIFIISILCIIFLYSFIAKTKQKVTTGKIAFSQHDSNYWQIWIMDLDGSNKKKLTNSKVDNRSANLSSDGKKIAYVTNEGKLWIMDANGNNKTQIALNISATEPKWCFQDKKIIFTSYRGVFFLDDSDIWMVNSDGSNLRNIIRRPSLQFLPDVSRDGKEILFVDVLESSSHEIFEHSGSFLAFPSAHPEERSDEGSHEILQPFGLQDELSGKNEKKNFPTAQIFKLTPETKDYIQLTDNNYHDSAPVFVGDSNMIAYSCDKDGNYDIWTMDKLGQNRKNLTKHPAFDSLPVATKDGKNIFFLSDRTGTMQIYSMDINGGNLKQITDDKQNKQDISIYTPSA